MLSLKLFLPTPYAFFIIRFFIHSDGQQQWFIMGKDPFISYNMTTGQHIKIKIMCLRVPPGC